MEDYLLRVKAKIIKDLVAMGADKKFHPALYIGKTYDFDRSAKRHLNNGYPILLRIAVGDSGEIALLEDALIEWAKKEKVFKCLNTNSGSAGSTSADKLYICFDSSEENDELQERDEVWYLGTEYPLNLEDWK